MDMLISKYAWISIDIYRYLYISMISKCSNSQMKALGRAKRLPRHTVTVVHEKAPVRRPSMSLAGGSWGPGPCQ